MKIIVYNRKCLYKLLFHYPNDKVTLPKHAYEQRQFLQLLEKDLMLTGRKYARAKRILLSGYRQQMCTAFVAHITAPELMTFNFNWCKNA